MRASTTFASAAGCAEADNDAPSCAASAPDTLGVDAWYSVHPANNAIAIETIKRCRIAATRRLAGVQASGWPGKTVVEVAMCVVVIEAKADRNAA
ncbi:hypothetical protein [Pandoraea morbifera]|uniref:hypothetical protein n=1 Tax=Pandoraea morbifera TaxID=2508300 RepID=UPI00123FCA90|nr:hypothetical protein [Pandoraea morbifera]